VSNDDIERALEIGPCHPRPLRGSQPTRSEQVRSSTLGCDHQPELDRLAELNRTIRERAVEPSMERAHSVDHGIEL